MPSSQNRTAAGGVQSAPLKRPAFFLRSLGLGRSRPVFTPLPGAAPGALGPQGASAPRLLQPTASVRRAESFFDRRAIDPLSASDAATRHAAVAYLRRAAAEAAAVFLSTAKPGTRRYDEAVAALRAEALAALDAALAEAVPQPGHTENNQQLENGQPPINGTDPANHEAPTDAEPQGGNQVRLLRTHAVIVVDHARKVADALLPSCMASPLVRCYSWLVGNSVALGLYVCCAAGLTWLLGLVPDEVALAGTCAAWLMLLCLSAALASADMVTAVLTSFDIVLLTFWTAVASVAWYAGPAEQSATYRAAAALSNLLAPTVLASFDCTGAALRARAWVVLSLVAALYGYLVYDTAFGSHTVGLFTDKEGALTGLRYAVAGLERSVYWVDVLRTARLNILICLLRALVSAAWNPEQLVFIKARLSEEVATQEHTQDALLFANTLKILKDAEAKAVRGAGGAPASSSTLVRWQSAPGRLASRLGGRGAGGLSGGSAAQSLRPSTERAGGSAAQPSERRLAAPTAATVAPAAASGIVPAGAAGAPRREAWSLEPPRGVHGSPGVCIGKC